MSNYDSQPIQTISASSENLNFDDLDSELVNKVLSWEEEFDVNELTEYLETSFKSRQNKTLNMEGIVTPPPETPVYETSIAISYTRFECRTVNTTRTFRSRNLEGLPPHGRKTLHNMASVTKSICAPMVRQQISRVSRSKCIQFEK